MCIDLLTARFGKVSIETAAERVSWLRLYCSEVVSSQFLYEGVLGLWWLILYNYLRSVLEIPSTLRIVISELAELI